MFPWCSTAFEDNNTEKKSKETFFRNNGKLVATKQFHENSAFYKRSKLIFLDQR